MTTSNISTTDLARDSVKETFVEWVDKALDAAAGSFRPQQILFLHKQQHRKPELIVDSAGNALSRNPTAISILDHTGSGGQAQDDFLQKG